MNRCLCPGHATGRRCWYQRPEWTRIARDVRRSGPCYVNGCPKPVAAADHIDPVHAGTTWAQFLSRTRLRPSCRRHNTARGVAARLERELENGVEVAQPVHPLVARGSFMMRRAG